LPTPQRKSGLLDLVAQSKRRQRRDRVARQIYRQSTVARLRGTLDDPEWDPLRM
jgi:hypothetical protein